MAGLLYGVRVGDPAAIAAMTLLLAAVTACAMALPARRAIRLDPAVALRDE